MPVETCKVCGNRAAIYVCQECGRKVCQSCFKPNMWCCSDCYNRLKRETLTLKCFQWSRQFKLFFLGIIIMFVGTIVIMITTVLFGTSTGGGAIIWIPPLPPIGFSTGPYAFWVIFLGVVPSVLCLVLFLTLRKRVK